MGFEVLFLIQSNYTYATIQTFKDLEISQVARVLCQKIYPLTFEEPVAKIFGIKTR